MLLKKPVKISVFKEFFLVFDAPSEGGRREPEGAEAHPRKDLETKKEPIKVDAKKETKTMGDDIGDDLTKTEESLVKYAKSYQEALTSQVKEEDLTEIRKKAESDETSLEDLQNDSEWLGVKIEDYDKKFGKLSKAYLEIKKDDSKKEVLIVKNDLDTNHKVKFGLGAGHLLPPSIASASITDLSGNSRTGKREIRNGKVGYYDENGYIPIFGGYTIEPKEFLQEGSEEYKTIVEAERKNHLERKTKPATTEPQSEQPTTATPNTEPQNTSPAPGPSEIQTPQPAEKPATAPAATAAPSASPSTLSEKLTTDLQKEIEKITENMSGTVAVSIFDPDTGKYLTQINQDKPTPPASLIKVPILFALHKAVRDGRVNKEDVSRLQEHAKKMIVDSNNQSTDEIIRYIGMPLINQCIHELGMKDTQLNRLLFYKDSGKPGENWTSANDMTKIMSLAINKEAPAGWASAMDLMEMNADTASPGSLAKTLPTDVKVAQKGGQLEKSIGAKYNVEHLAATFTIGAKKLVMIVMVKDFDTRNHAKEGIRKIGRLACDEIRRRN